MYLSFILSYSYTDAIDDRHIGCFGYNSLKTTLVDFGSFSAKHVYAVELCINLCFTYKYMYAAKQVSFKFLLI